ncbi:phage tail protein [Kosakonia cowanii]|uniref:phage tail protein n=1 Tax=Kosakonia cowanii TaxID=208223 RepID=UPI0023F7A5DB|nr:phage tail protein [Kosakonia cowanii]MDF7759660.1 phage tail protein [Kosakonia cowanii]
MTMKYFAILTHQGAAKLANATALGTQLKLTHMATGDGNGTLPTPDPAQTKLVNQKRIAPLNMLFVDPGDANQIIAEQVIPESEGGFWIREIGLYDADGTLIAVANCPETYKPLLLEGSARTQTLRMALVVSSTSAVSLKIDPAVVLATRHYADKLMSDHIYAPNPHGQYLQIAQSLKEIANAGSASVAAALKNLGLGEAAKRAVGNGNGQVPDMNLFGKMYPNGGVAGAFTLPNGLIIQTAAITSIAAGASVEVTYPIPFPVAMCFATGVATGAADSTVPISIGIDAQNVADARKTLLLRNFSTRANAGSRYLAIGY